MKKIKDNLSDEETVKREETFTKKQLVSSEKFSGRRDILNALLSEEKSCTAYEAEEIITNYMKGQVK